MLPWAAGRRDRDCDRDGDGDRDRDGIADATCAKMQRNHPPATH